MMRLELNVYNSANSSFTHGHLLINGGDVLGFEADGLPVQGDLFLSVGFIDSHAHVYPGGTNLGIDADRIGLNTGVHLIVDAGSAGALNYGAWQDYIVPTFKTPVRAFLNVSQIGLITKLPYSDLRNLSIDAAISCIKTANDGMILGIKVLSSGLIVEDNCLAPIKSAVSLAERTGLPIMAHLAEGPPSNDDNMALLRTGDIISHCFHGVVSIAANQKSSTSSVFNPRHYALPNIMWNEDGSPIQALENAMQRGVYLDVGHGAASFDSLVAKRALDFGIRNFSISSDAHVRNIDTKVISLCHVMSKFLALGMTLGEVFDCVTIIPAKQLRLNWPTDPLDCGTLVRLRPITEGDSAFFSGLDDHLTVSQLIEPVCTIQNRKISYCNL